VAEEINRHGQHISAWADTTATQANNAGPQCSVNELAQHRAQQAALWSGFFKTSAEGKKRGQDASTDANQARRRSHPPHSRASGNPSGFGSSQPPTPTHSKSQMDPAFAR